MIFYYRNKEHSKYPDFERPSEICLFYIEPGEELLPDNFEEPMDDVEEEPVTMMEEEDVTMTTPITTPIMRTTTISVVSDKDVKR